MFVFRLVSTLLKVAASITIINHHTGLFIGHKDIKLQSLTIIILRPAHHLNPMWDEIIVIINWYNTVDDTHSLFDHMSDKVLKRQHPFRIELTRARDEVLIIIIPR